MQRQLARSIGMFSCMMLTISALGQPDRLWLDQFGAGGEDIATGLAPDGSGGVFVAGGTDGSLGGPNAGDVDIFVARYDAAGDQVWITQFGTSARERAYALAPDEAGGAYIAGYTTGEFGGPNAGAQDVFLARLNADRTIAWVVQFGTGVRDVAWALAPDGAGGVFVGGETSGSLGGANAGGSDIFCARYDSTGNQAWLVQFGTGSDDIAAALASDGAGGAFIAGTTYGSLGGTNAGWADVFLARRGDDGSPIWLTQIGTTWWDRSTSLAADGGGGVFLAGYTDGDLGGPSAGGPDAFLARYDSGGGQAWITQFGSPTTDSANALAPDGEGGVWVAGGTWGDLNGFNAGGLDTFLSHHNAAGTQTGIAQFGDYGTDYAWAAAPDGAGGVVVGGYTDGNLDGWNAGGVDVLVARYGSACYPDCDSSGALDLFDFLCFVNLFNAGADAADCDGNGGLDLFDFLCFVNAFNAGC